MPGQGRAGQGQGGAQGRAGQGRAGGQGQGPSTGPEDWVLRVEFRFRV